MCQDLSLRVSVCAALPSSASHKTNNRLVFGLKSSVKDNLHFLEDGSYVYPAGHTVVISSDGKTHRFLPGSPECEGISAIMLSPNKKLLAVAERAEKAVVSVYDMQTLKLRKQLVAADVGSKVSLQASAALGHVNRAVSTSHKQQDVVDCPVS